MARPISSRRTGRRPISTGWRTSSPGAFRASFGGAIRFRLGTGRTAKYLPHLRKRKLLLKLFHFMKARERRYETDFSPRWHRVCRRPSREPVHALSRRRRARHLVLLRAVAVLDARLAGRDAGAQALLSDQRAGHRLRHHLLLGRPHDDDGAAFHARSAVPRRLHPRAGARRLRRQDVEVEGQRHRPARASSTTTAPMRCASRSPPWRRRAATSSSRPSASRATAISRPSCGTPRASPR